MISTQRVNIYDELRISPAEWGYHYVVGRGASEVQETEGLKETEETLRDERDKREATISIIVRVIPSVPLVPLVFYCIIAYPLQIHIFFITLHLWLY